MVKHVLLFFIFSLNAGKICMIYESLDGGGGLKIANH